MSRYRQPGLRYSQVVKRWNEWRTSEESPPYQMFWLDLKCGHTVSANGRYDSRSKVRCRACEREDRRKESAEE